MVCQQCCAGLLDLGLTSTIESVIPRSADADIVGPPLPAKIIITRAAQDAVVTSTTYNSSICPCIIAGSPQDQIIGARSTTKCSSSTPHNVGQIHAALRWLELVSRFCPKVLINSARSLHNVGSRKRSEDTGQHQYTQGKNSQPGYKPGVHPAFPLERACRLVGFR